MLSKKMTARTTRQVRRPGKSAEANKDVGSTSSAVDR